MNKRFYFKSLIGIIFQIFLITSFIPSQVYSLSVSKLNSHVLREVAYKESFTHKGRNLGEIKFLDLQREPDEGVEKKLNQLESWQHEKAYLKKLQEQAKKVLEDEEQNIFKKQIHLADFHAEGKKTIILLAQLLDLDVGEAERQFDKLVNTEKLKKGETEYKDNLKYSMKYLFKYKINEETGKNIDEIGEQELLDYVNKEYGNVEIYFEGDIFDRGYYGIHVNRLLEELLKLGLLRVRITGNHDILGMANLLGYHLMFDTKDIQKGGKYYDLYVESGNNDKDFKELRVIKLAELDAEMNKFQEQFEQSAVAVRKLFSGIDKKKLLKEEKEVLEWVCGRKFGINIYTGIAMAGKMSMKKWEEYKDRFDKIIKAKKKLLNLGNFSRFDDALILDKMKKIHEKFQDAYEKVKKMSEEKVKLKDSKDKEKKINGLVWDWYEDLNEGHYKTFKWASYEWLFHKGWGTWLIEEADKMDGKKGSVKTENYIKDSNLRDLGQSIKNCFKLFYIDDYGNLHSHGAFPLTSLKKGKGHLEFTYQGSEEEPVTYKGETFLYGLRKLEQDVKKADLKTEAGYTKAREALKLIYSWYADSTTTIKEEHLQHYEWRRVLDKIGVSGMWIMGHNPYSSKLAPKGLDLIHKDAEGRPVVLFVDHGINEAKYTGIGGAVVCDPKYGIYVVGFEKRKSYKLKTSPSMEFSKKGSFIRQTETEKLKVSKKAMFEAMIANIDRRLKRLEELIKAGKEIKSKV